MPAGVIAVIFAFTAAAYFVAARYQAKRRVFLIAKGLGLLYVAIVYTTISIGYLDAPTMRAAHLGRWGLFVLASLFLADLIVDRQTWT